MSKEWGKAEEEEQTDTMMSAKPDVRLHPTTSKP